MCKRVLKWLISTGAWPAIGEQLFKKFAMGSKIMLRFFSNNIKPTINRRTMCSNVLNPRLYARDKFSKEPVSSHLKVLLNKYFHPYQFFIQINPLTSHPLKDFSTLLFDVTQIENANGLNYKATANFDPVIKLVNTIIDKELDVGFKISSGLFLPGFLPLHFSLRILAML
jgi:hypothetical protein